MNKTLCSLIAGMSLIVSCAIPQKSIIPKEKHSLLNKLGHFPMPNISHLIKVYEEHLTCDDLNKQPDITIRKYSMDNGMIVAATASRYKADKHYAIRVINGMIYLDKNEDGFIDESYKAKDNPPTACEMKPPIYEI